MLGSLGFTSFQQKAKNVLCLKVSQWNLGSCNFSLACFHYPPLSGVTISVHLRLGLMNHHTDASINTQSKSSFVFSRRHDCFSRGHIGSPCAPLVDAFTGSSVLPINEIALLYNSYDTAERGAHAQGVMLFEWFLWIQLIYKNEPHHTTSQHSYRRCASQYSNIVRL
jgi:hypothetical protein